MIKKLVINSDGKIDYKMKLTKEEIMEGKRKRAEAIRYFKEEMKKGNYYV